MKSTIQLLLLPLVASVLIGCADTCTDWYASYSVAVAPPPLPYYAQPPCPYPGDSWIPGHWAFGDGGYYWSEGYWTAPPAPGLLWTPGYWRFDDDSDGYLWVQGHWGRTVGYYGGVNYGFGYEGEGFHKEYRDEDHFRGSLRHRPDFDRRDPPRPDFQRDPRREQGRSAWQGPAFLPPERAQPLLGPHRFEPRLGSPPARGSHAFEGVVPFAAHRGQERPHLVLPHAPAGRDRASQHPRR